MGAKNDKTISKNDALISAVANDPIYNLFEWQLDTSAAQKLAQAFSCFVTEGITNGGT
jgi:hypothetical protein